MARRHIWWEEREYEQRAQRAARWRKARDRLFALPDELRRTVRQLWRSCPYPADPAYLLDLLHQIAVGRVDPHRPPWVFDGKLTARTTPYPEKFDEARGDCSDAELELIRRLAQEADTRPVVVRHVANLISAGREEAGHDEPS
jgi:hypothetical protein